jgi:GntR family transcriptional regulator
MHMRGFMYFLIRENSCPFVVKKFFLTPTDNCYISVITLQFRIESSSGIPINRQIADQIRAACATHTLLPGEKLPSVRELARQLAINQNTVLRVYEKLTAEGILERRHGDGTYIADRLPANQLRTQRTILREEFLRLVRRAQSLGLDFTELRHWLNQAVDKTENIDSENSRHSTSAGKTTR